MNRSFCILTSVFWILPAAFAAVSGTVTNATTGQPQGNVSINLVQPGQQGMRQLGTTTTAANGSFSFDATPQPGGPALLQATYRDVTYSQIMPPGTPTTNVRVMVYEATADAPAEMQVNHLLLLEPGVEKLQISETYLIRNNSNLAYHDAANGTIRIYLPPGAPEGLSMEVNSTGVPVQRPLIKTNTAGLYKVDYPAKPGETRYDLGYSIPAVANFTLKAVQSTPPMRLITPASVTLSGEGITDMGQENEIGARIYQVTGPTINVSITGTGALRNPNEGQSAEDAGAPKCCEEIPAQIHEKLPWILGLGIAILSLGGVLLYRRGAA